MMLQRILGLGLLSPFTLLLLFPVFFVHDAAAQESVEDRMRDALRQSVAEMRSAQDQAAQAQADLQKAQADKVALQAQLDAANAKLAAAPAVKPAELEALKAQLQAAQQADTRLRQINAQLQSRLENAVAAGQAKDDQSRRAAAALTSVQSDFGVCKSANSKLVGVSEDILHLYESQDFRTLLLKSYEPVLGLARVKLQNIVQQYDDRIYNQEYFGATK